MKRVVTALAISLSFSFAIAEEKLSMSASDVALYAEAENPGEMYIFKGEDVFKKELKATESELAKFFGVEEAHLAKEIASFPKYMKKVDRVVALDQALQIFMSEKGLTPYKLADKNMVNLLLFVKSLANDENININLEDKHLKEYYKMGEELFNTKRGMRGLSCYSCHNPQVAGQRLRMQNLPDLKDANVKPSATWPAYRMTQTQVVTLQERFRQCMNNASQAKLPLGAEEMIALEVYVTSFSNKQPMAVPGLKR